MDGWIDGEDGWKEEVWARLLSSKSRNTKQLKQKEKDDFERNCESRVYYPKKRPLKQLKQKERQEDREKRLERRGLCSAVIIWFGKDTGYSARKL